MKGGDSSRSTAKVAFHFLMTTAMRLLQGGSQRRRRGLFFCFLRTTVKGNDCNKGGFPLLVNDYDAAAGVAVCMACCFFMTTTMLLPQP